MKKKYRFGFVLTLLEKTALKEIADSEGGLSKAALIRRLIRQSAIEKGLWPSIQTNQANKPNQKYDVDRNPEGPGRSDY